MSEKMIRGMTFDLWHTVLREPMEDFAGHLRNERTIALTDVFREHGLVTRLEDIERAYDVQGQRLFDIWNRGVDIDQRAQIGIILSELGISADQVDETLIGDLMRQYTDVLALVPPVPFDGANELLGKLKNRGMSLAIISNTGRTGGDFFRELMKNHDLAHYFDVMTFSNEAGIRKPNKEIFLKTLEEMDISPEEAMHVGDDSDTDVIGARRAGMKCVLLLVPGRDTDRGQPDFVVSELSDVLRIVEYLEGAD
ncbi:MAG: HAD family hydrolase [Thermoplasmata archaeon]